MAEKDKKFYWIKLRQSLLTSEKVDYLMSQKNGANYVVLYQCLCLKTINTSGELATTLGELIVPFDEQKIERECKWFDIDTIRVAMSLYKNLGLIYEQDNGILKITDFEDLVGSETYWAKQKRIERDREKEELKQIGQSLDNVQHTLISNILTLISNKGNLEDIKEEFIKYGFSNDLAISIIGWLLYKKERKQTYKERGLETLLNKLLKDSEELGEEVICKGIENSMTNNWSGIFYDKNAKLQPKEEKPNDIDFLIAKGFSKEWVMALSEEERREKIKKWEK